MNAINIDVFAGGGGASLAMEAAGLPVHVAINHDPEAIAVHAANHPDCEHICQDVFEAKPLSVSRGRRIASGWFSPDCTHHSKAKGGKPLSNKRRSLAWVTVDYARDTGLGVIYLENVEEFADWCPLDAHGRPIKTRRGETFRQWVNALELLGYRVGHAELSACDYGAPTTRKRLFLCARRDGAPIAVPAPTHARGGIGAAKPWRTAAEIIDWSIPCPSIFMSREEARAYYEATGVRVQRPLAPKTMARIAKGVKRFVLDAKEPFIITITHGRDVSRGHGLSEPLRTITSAHRGEMALIAPFLAQHNNHRGHEPNPGHDVRGPLSAIVGKGCTQALVHAHLMNMKGDGRHRSIAEPTFAQCASGNHIAEVRAFLMKYHWSGGQHQDMLDPLHTVDAKARFGLVTIHGAPYRIVDIGMRMLTVNELKRGQGLPDDYELQPVVNGKRISKTSAIAKIGNSVSPAPAIAWIKANPPPRDLDLQVAA